MTRVRIDLFSSLDGYTAAPDASSDNPMGEDWGPLPAAYAATRTFRQKVFGDASGEGTTGVDDAYASRFFVGVGAENMGAAMFGLHTYPDDPDWKGWWGDEPPFGTPVYVLTNSAPRPSRSALSRDIPDTHPPRWNRTRRRRPHCKLPRHRHRARWCGSPR